MTECKNCKTTLTDDAVYCSKCGQKTDGTQSIFGNGSHKFESLGCLLEVVPGVGYIYAGAVNIGVGIFAAQTLIVLIWISSISSAFGTDISHFPFTSFADVAGMESGLFWFCIISYICRAFGVVIFTGMENHKITGKVTFGYKVYLTSTGKPTTATHLNTQNIIGSQTVARPNGSKTTPPSSQA
jgi:hypothetical protein